jgi:predicted ATPase/DNA-binding winged helix-turn-helix (wHTH) protein
MRFGAAGRFELQPAERRLLVDGQPAGLGARALDLLITLAEQPDHLMTKSELLDRVWPGLVVEEANLQVQISNLRKLLGGDVIATVPGRGYRFAAALDQGISAAAPPVTPARATSPSVVPTRRLFGRDSDLALLDTMLQGGGCVTLVGASGVGKTSLARAAAARWNGRCVWVDLAALSHENQVIAALARALEIRLSDGEPASQLLRALRGNALLLVLDNAEHLVRACAELATLFRPLPEVLLLVTSQLPLAVAGERVQRLEPLAVAAADASATELGDGALALLVERIVAADHRFRVTTENLSSLRTVCTQVDGLPLALEMAAARVPSIGLQGVCDALAQRFALLTRGHRDAAARHRTLHNALDWSYRLLAEPEQRLFRALGVFAGGFTLDLAVALIAENDADARWDVIDRLAALVDRSLVVASSDDPPRYRLLETMRAYALEQLALAGEENPVRKRHAAALLAVFASWMLGDAALEARCRPEMDNARDAITWARSADLKIAALLTAHVSRSATFTAWRHESGNWMHALEPLMQQPAGQALPQEIQANWWTELAHTLTMRGDPRASAVAKRGADLWRPLGQPRQLLFAAVVWVRSVRQPGAELDNACADLQACAAALPDMTPRERLRVHSAFVKAALTRNDQAAVLEGRLAEMTLAQELGVQYAVDAAESNVVNALNALRCHTEAAARGRALLARIDRAGGDGNGNVPYVLSGLLDGLVNSGELQEARALVPRAFAALQRFDSPVVTTQLAALAAAQRRFEAAARLIGYARRSHEARSMTIDPDDERVLVNLQTAVAELLGIETSERLVREGRSVTDDAARTLALGD